MNPNTKPITPQTSKGNERDLMRFLMALQAAVEDDAEDNRFATRDRSIQPLGTSHAAEITGRSRRYVQNTLNPNNETNPLGIKEFYRLWVRGLDISVIEELVRPRGVVVFELGEAEAQDGHHLSMHAIQLGKEVGDLFAELERGIDPMGEDGADISLHELDRFTREAMEIFPKVLLLIEDMKARAASCR